MATTFTYVPSYTSQVGEVVRKKSVVFGDGYQQDSTDGINPTSGVFQLVFDVIDTTTLNAIVSFLRTAGGVNYFLWTPNFAGYTTQMKFKCDSWQTTANQYNNYTLTATFYQVFDL